MAQTKKRRRRKHRGTQSGRVDRRQRGRPRNRQEARARARGVGAARFERPPTWRGAINRALIAAAIFTVLLIVAFGRPVAAAVAFGVAMLAFYIPMGYLIDNMIWRRRLRARDKAREQA